MKKIISVFFMIVAVALLSEASIAGTKYTYTYITPKAPAVTESLKPCIVRYKRGDYTGAMMDLKALLEKEKNNTYARYYLALCYMKLGYAKESKEEFNKVIEDKSNETLVYYSTKAVACIDNPKSEICNPNLAAGNTEEGAEEKKEVEEDDITKFIYSGKKIHPAAMDLIIKERMEIKLQQDEYKRKQNEQMGPLSAAPTNEEIASALNTLSKIGINPFGQNYMLSGVPELGYMNNYNSMPYAYGNSTFDIGQMLLYSQLNQQKNNFINYGI